MDLTRLAVDAGQLINRAVQYTGESLGQADKTELEPGLEELLTRAQATKTWTDRIISQTEVLLQPNPGARLEDRLYEHLDWNVPPRPRAQEVLGDQMTQAGLEIGSNTPYGTALLRCGEVQKQFGLAERKFVQSTNIHFLTPLRNFTEGEHRAIQDECKMLLNKRLDLDIAKTRLRKAHEADRESRNLNANPLEDDYLSHVSYMFSFLRVKWLKLWAQEISQAEMELRICQSLFDRQSENARQVLEGISNTHTIHMRSLTDFVEAQASYFDQCNQHAQELRKQLASIPAVLCSNNWQSALNDGVPQPSAGNHEINEPIRLNHVTSVPGILQHLPEFDQDSWTTNPPSGTENTLKDSSVGTQPHDQTNNNNNNNTFSTGNRVASCHSSSESQSSSYQEFDHVCVSGTNRHPTDQLSAPSSTVNSLMTINRMTAEPFNATAAATNGAGSRMTTTNAVANETMATNDLAGQPETTYEMEKKQPPASGEDIQESSSD
ncbi:endophilin-B1-like [Anabas testudineus]|nr:endophilin-B1-like [Anabas testudineus]